MFNQKNYIQSLMILLTIIMFSCSIHENNQENTIHKVKIKEAIDENKKIILSDFTLGEVGYIPLESKKECLLGNNARLYLNDSEIIAFAKNQIYVFDRKTGKFLREIGHYGKDPGGYKKTVYAYPYDEIENTFYTGGWEPKIYYKYNSKGELKEKITAYSIERETNIQKSIVGEIVTSIAPLNDTCFVGHIWNINGKQENKLIIFNENNHRIKTYPQHKTFEWDINKDGITVFKWDAWFYKFNNQLNFFERFTDTIFSVSMEKLIPKFVFDGSYLIESLTESDNFLLFNFRHEEGYYSGFYDKKKRETKITEQKDGIVSDKEEFVPFQFFSVNSKEEVIGSQEAYKVRLWFNENPEKVTKLPSHLKKLNNVKETDNPVVIIAKLK